MNPEDDAYWPMCSDHQEKHWCNWTANFFRHNQDAEDIRPGLRYCVPIVPGLNAYAEVSIGPDWISDQFSPLHLIKHQGAVFSPDELEVSLGFWTKGEGRVSIASVIADWADGVVPDMCYASTHGYREEQRVLELLRSDVELQKKLYWWDLAYHGMCTFCWARRLSTQTGAASASSQGLDPKDFGSSPGGANQGGAVVVYPNSGTTNSSMTNVSGTSTSTNTLDALRQRFKS